MKNEIKIIVRTENDKKQLLEASKHIHDSRDIDTDLPMVNMIAHLHHNPDLIEVEEPLQIPCFYLLVTADEKIAVLDGRIKFESHEETFQVFVNGVSFGQGPLEATRRRSLSAGVFEPSEKLPSEVRPVSCYLCTYDIQMSRQRQIPLSIKRLPVERSIDHDVIDDDRR